MEAADVIDVSPSLRLHKYKTHAETPLVLLMPWMTCTEKAVERYRQLYARRGYNVLTLFPKSSYYYWPSSAKVIAREIIHILLTHTDVAASPIIVHAFSIGSVVYSILLSQMLAENSKEIGELQDRIVGHVFDSMIIEGPWDRVKGVAHILSSRWLMQQLIFSVAHVYYLLTYKYTQRVMNEAKEAMYKNPFQTPLLVFYSAVDPMCKTKTMEDFVRCWADRTGQLAHLKAWDDAPHAGGLQKYPEEYTKTLFKYMDSLELKGAQNHPSKL
ncbi:transmembrane protein 53-like [Asterias amurensis]|uniref:transmembrane protein 53-like n=1 Tax=Asterias amurensis TaxID=7602 RepID=UPI003AB861F3